MPAAHGGNPTSASSCEVDELLDFGDRLRLEIKFGGRMKGSRPGGLGVIFDSAEGYVVVELAQLGGDCGVHFADSRTRSLDEFRSGLNGGW